MVKLTKEEIESIKQPDSFIGGILYAISLLNSDEGGMTIGLAKELLINLTKDLDCGNFNPDFEGNIDNLKFK